MQNPLNMGGLKNRFGCLAGWILHKRTHWFCSPQMFLPWDRQVKALCMVFEVGVVDHSVSKTGQWPWNMCSHFSEAWQILSLLCLSDHRSAHQGHKLSFKPQARGQTVYKSASLTFPASKMMNQQLHGVLKGTVTNSVRLNYICFDRLVVKVMSSV